MRSFVVDNVVKPLPHATTMWSGTARSPRRFYEWFYDSDGGHVKVRAEQPKIPGCFIYRRPPPKAFKDLIIRAVKTAQH